MSSRSDRVALVTGGSQGIGRSAALALARAGTTVVVHGLERGGAEDVADQIRRSGGSAAAAAGRLQDPDVAAMAVQTALDRFGRLDVLVSSVGIQRYGDVVSTPPAVWEEVFAINVTSVYRVAHAALPEIRRSGSGSVVIVASVQATATQSQVAAYTSSKGALLALTRAMAVDEAAYGVRVNSVSPGSVDTPMLRESARLMTEGSAKEIEEVIATWGTAHPLGRVATPDEVGEVIAFLAGPGSSFVTGADVRVDGGLLARLAAPLTD